jgi:hypothetical protein
VCPSVVSYFSNTYIHTLTKSSVWYNFRYLSSIAATGGALSIVCAGVTWPESLAAIRIASRVAETAESHTRAGSFFKYAPIICSCIYRDVVL